VVDQNKKVRLHDGHGAQPPLTYPSYLFLRQRISNSFKG
jgi:hypothetical protein